MFSKKIYFAMVLFLAISGSILTWILFYDDFPHNSPVRAKQVFKIGDTADLSCDFSSKYNTVNHVQTISEARLFN